MEALAIRYITEDEYDQTEELAPVKREYFNGEVYAMAGGTERHALIGSNVTATLHVQLKGKKCRVVGGELRVKIEATGLQTYPDVTVYCAPARYEGKGNQILLSPSVIIEVLSPSTENYDRGAKFEHYRKIPELRDYLLVTQSHVWVEHRRRLDDEDWTLKNYTALDQTIALESSGCKISLADLYDGIEVSAVLPLRTQVGEDE